MSWPALFLSGPEAAAGFALINSIGALGGFLGPYAVGLLAGGAGGSGYGVAMLTLAAFLLVSGALILGAQEPVLFLMACRIGVCVFPFWLQCGTSTPTLSAHSPSHR